MAVPAMTGIDVSSKHRTLGQICTKIGTFYATARKDGGRRRVIPPYAITFSNNVRHLKLGALATASNEQRAESWRDQERAAGPQQALAQTDKFARAKNIRRGAVPGVQRYLRQQA